MKAKIKRWLRLKKLEKLQANPLTWSYANHVEWSRLAMSQLPISNCHREE
jgi:hypothetical protein